MNLPGSNVLGLKHGIIFVFPCTHTKKYILGHKNISHIFIYILVSQLFFCSPYTEGPAGRL